MKARAIAIFVAIVAGTATLYAQAPAQSVSPIAAVGAIAAIDPSVNAVRILVGRSAIVNVGKPIARVSLTSSDVADALVTSPSELLVNGKTPGTISMFVWDRGGAVQRYEVVVQRDLDRLAEQVKQIFPGEKIEITASGKNIALSGTVSNKDVIEKVTNLAAGFVESKAEVVSLLQLGPGAPSNQVLLHVRFAEVSRSAMTELGAGLFTSATGISNTLGRVTTDQIPGPTFSDLSVTKASSDVGSAVTSATGKLTFSDFLNLFLFNEKYDIGVLIKALQSKGLFQSLAEPNLVSESGKEASFLAGGEFPVPVPQATGGGTTITVTYKEFGIRLTFTPVVNGDRIHLKVKPEVSTLDFGNALQLNGFTIPALNTRRTETELELQDHQTFAIAGLMNNSMRSTLQKIPGIGDIPVLGLLFKSKSAQKDQTELVVMITPEILPLNSSGVSATLPKIVEPYLPALPSKSLIDLPPPAFSPARQSDLDTPMPARADKTPAKQTPDPAAQALLSSATPGKRGPTVHLDNTGAPIDPAAKPAAAPTAAAPAVSHPLTPDERKQFERAQKDEQRRGQADLRLQAAQAKRDAQLAEQERRTQKAADDKKKAAEEQQARLDREQAERDASLQKRAAAEAAAQAKKQAEIDRKQQKSIDEAAARMKAAEAAYQAELAKKQGQ